MAQAKGLGKGLSALLGEQVTPLKPASNDTLTTHSNEIAINNLSPWSLQPRKHFGEDELAELAESIAKNGVVQPIIVREKDTDNYEIIAGERRWRAAKIAGLDTIPAILIDVSDDKALEIALIENIQRQDLKPLELAESYSRLIEEFSYTQEQLATELGISRSQVANIMRLQTLPEKVKTYLNEDKLSMGHARTLVGNNFAEAAADTIVNKGLSVRQTEKLVKDLANTEQKPAKKQTEKLSEITEIEASLSKSLGLRVKVEDKGNKGKVIISYHSLRELDTILKQLQD